VNNIQGTLAATAVMMLVLVGGCAKEAEQIDTQSSVALEAIEGENAGETAEVRGEGSGEHSSEGSGERSREGSGEHEGESSGEHGGEGQHGEEGEESGIQYGLNDTYDETRYGARLILTFDEESNSFVGTVENTTKEILNRVRVEVHLSNGIELGPTNTADLTPGEKRNVKLTAISTGFDKWSAHPEVGSGDGG